MNIFSLFGSIFVDSSAAEESISKTDKKAESFAGTLGKGIATAGKFGAAVLAGATAAAGGMIAMATSSAATADNIDKMSQKIGISRQAYQELDFICSQSGTSVDNLKAGIKTLTGQMDKAAEGADASKEAFEKLGVAWADDNGNLKSQEEVMWEVMEALQGIENQTEKSALATQLFGKAGLELMPLLNGASGSIEEMKQQAHDLGLVLSDDLINNGVNMTDAMDQMKRSFSAIVTNIGGSLMPIVEQLCDLITANLPLIQDAVSSITPILQKALQSIIPPIMQLAERLLPVMLEIIDIFVPIISQIADTIMPIIINLLDILIPPLIDIVEMILPLLLQLIEPLLPLLQPIFELLQPFIELLVMILEPLTELISMILPVLIDVLVSLTESLMIILKPAINIIVDLLNNYFTVAFKLVHKIVGTVLDFITDKFKKLDSFFKDILPKVSDFMVNTWESIKKKVSDAISTLHDNVKNTFEKMVSAIKAPINSIIGMINKLIDAMNGLSWTFPDWIPELGGKTFGFNIPKINYLANGGILTSPTLLQYNPLTGSGTVAGEAGAEAVIPIDKLKLYIREEIAATNDRMIELLTSILSVIENIDITEITLSALNGLGISINEREFGRLVKQVG